jgi:uncharacterized sporulation protein YeaH/YhbH (DUF444 family)
MAEVTADEIDEMGNGVTATAKRMLASAHERRRRKGASAHSDLAHELDLEIADIEEDTAIRLELSEEAMHSLADLKRKVDGE